MNGSDGVVVFVPISSSHLIVPLNLTMAGLNVVALISGGKDSLYSLLHCQAHGHRIVALANLHPPKRGKCGGAEDLESYMYQTIGHGTVPLYQEALALPLFRQEISGEAVNRDKTYGPATTSADHDIDETESLLPLLRRVKQAYPEVNAVNSGAILSDYQRTRVESVAIRLGLTPLAYLWQWPTLPPHTPTSLLEDMAAVGQDARIVKVASGGLDDSFLWLNVAAAPTITRLSKATQRFGSPGDGAVLGEGGEYETLAVGGPAPLWKGRIVVRESDVSIVPGDAGSASVKLQMPCVRPQEAETVPDVRIPPLLDRQFEQLLEALKSPGVQALVRDSEVVLAHHSRSSVPNGFIALPNITGEVASAPEQAHTIMEQMLARLRSAGYEAENIAYTIIILRDMADFAAINTVYGSYFTHPNPPARLTIACANVLPPTAHLAISFFGGSCRKEGLHVQSRSYWAPANIGPYSQAIKFPGDASLAILRGSVFIAGQIPLVPATMALAEAQIPSDSFALQAVLALQHLVRVGQSMKVNDWTFGLAFIVAATDDHASVGRRAEVARNAWRLYHEGGSIAIAQDAPDDDAEDFDVWHLANRPGRAPWSSYQHSDRTEKKPAPAGQAQVPPLVVVQADALPREADIEWVGYGRSVLNLPLDNAPAVPLHLQDFLEQFKHRIV